MFMYINIPEVAVLLQFADVLVQQSASESKQARFVLFAGQWENPSLTNQRTAP